MVKHSYGSLSNNEERNSALQSNSFQLKLTKTLVGILGICGFLVICTQFFIFWSFTRFYDSSTPDTYGVNWPEIYNAVILGTAAINVLFGSFFYCIPETRNEYLIILGIVFNMFSTTGSIFAFLMSGAELTKITDECSTHIGIEYNESSNLERICTMRWVLQLLVVIFIGSSLFANITSFIVLSIRLCCYGKTGIKKQQLVGHET